MNDTPKTIEISRIKDDAKDTKTFFFEHNALKFEPGQFIMLWIPGVDMKPFTISYHTKKEFGVTVFRRGPFTKKLFEMKKDDKLGFTGSHGNGFSMKKDAVVVGGGCGMAPLAPLVEQLENPRVIIGAKSKENLLFVDRFKKAIVCTDDGTAGAKGFTTQVLEQEIEKKKPSIVYTCGPEIMIQKVFELCEKNKIECEASLERYFRCGLGVCGSCACGDQLVCKDGPVFNSGQLRRIEDFGKFARLKSGKKVSLEEYSSYRSTNDKP